MPRARDPNREKAFEIYKLHNGNIDLVEIASQLNIPPGTVRGWKNKDAWNGTLGINTERSKKEENVTKEIVTKEIKQVINNPDINDKQRLFCLYYIKCFNATKAYQKAYGVDYNTAASIAYRLLEHDGVKNEIQRLKQSKLNQILLEPSDIFQKYMDIAFCDITDYLEFGRETVPVMGPFGPILVKDAKTNKKIELTKEINIVKFKESCEVDGSILSEVKQGKDGASIKLADKMKALQWLAEHMNMATEKQKAEIAILQSKVQSDAIEETENDGFIEALNGKVDEIWSNE